VVIHIRKEMSQRSWVGVPFQRTARVFLRLPSAPYSVRLLCLTLGIEKKV
jgi:hypothetical protein